MSRSEMIPLLLSMILFVVAAMTIDAANDGELVQHRRLSR